MLGKVKKEKQYASYQIIKQEWTVINGVKEALCVLTRVWGCGREAGFIFSWKGRAHFFEVVL